LSKLTDKNRLSIVYPNLAQEWDYNKNLASPKDITSQSHKKVFWKCKEGHSWEARIAHRSDGTGCPKCSRINFRKQSLLSALPTIKKIWHPILNRIKPDQIGRGSERKAWFICKKRHIWQAAIYSVYINYKKGKIPCPICNGKKITEENCLANNFPDLAREWHSTKNKDLTPYNVGKGSAKKIWWKCKKGHEWKTTVNIRTSQGTRCPYCYNSKLSPKNNLAVKYPQIAVLWHSTKNDKTPFQVTAKTNDIYWWKCKKGHEWKTRVSHLVNGYSSCPICNRIELKDGKSFRSLVEAFWYIKFKKTGLKFKCESYYPKNIKIGKSKYDFYFPDFKIYVEVTGYGKEWKYWKRYIKQIKRKKCYVEKILHKNFCFIHHILTKADRELVHKYIK
jgi:hypothetical protein